MRYFFRPAAFVLCLASCQLLEPSLSVNRPRIEEGLHTVVPSPEKEDPDTVLLVSALCFPQSYDWQKDSLFGRVPCTLKLFRDGEEALSLSAGPGTFVSASHDGHHIIDGSLFTEYSDQHQTVICRDGVKVASWSGRERLVGLLVRDETLYTLGCSSAGLVYRKNGIETLKISDGVPFGGFRFNTYGSGGALYEVDGAVCFAFQAPRGGVPTVFFAMDGEPKEVFSAPDADLLDAKMLGDGVVVLYKEQLYTSLRYGSGKNINLPHSEHIAWNAAEIALVDGMPAAVGYCRYDNDAHLSFGISRYDYAKRLKDPPLAVYFSGGALVPVYAGVEVPPDCFFMSRDCACLSPEGPLTLALTPRDAQERPYVLSGGERTEYPVDGFLTGVSYHISY
ncbi:MAG: hypothetical protein J5533_01760 [Bacteroidales bacterium]|nr:hypothetical protein [Bacteroidales bacterium]